MWGSEVRGPLQYIYPVHSRKIIIVVDDALNKIWTNLLVAASAPTLQETGVASPGRAPGGVGGAERGLGVNGLVGVTQRNGTLDNTEFQEQVYLIFWKLLKKSALKNKKPSELHTCYQCVNG